MRLWLNTIRDYIAHMNFRHAPTLRSANTSFGLRPEVDALMPRLGFYFLTALYDSTVLVWMVQVVSPRCMYWDCVVTVRVTLQLVSVAEATMTLTNKSKLNRKELQNFFIMVVCLLGLFLCCVRLGVVVE